MIDTESELASEIQVFFIYLKFHADFSENDDPIVSLRRLRKLGKVTVIPHTNSVPSLEDYEVNKLYIQWTVKLSTEKSQTDIEELLESAIADTRNSIKIEQITLPPPDPGILNQATEEKLLSTAPAVQKVFESSEIFDSAWFKIGRNIFMFAHQCSVKPTQNEKTIVVQGDVVDLISLHEVLHLPQTQDLKKMSVLILENNEKKQGFLVDEVISPRIENNATIKVDFSQQPYISSAILLENDEIAFKLDVSQLIN